MTLNLSTKEESEYYSILTSEVQNHISSILPLELEPSGMCRTSLFS